MMPINIFTTVDDPLAPGSTRASGINDMGQIVRMLKGRFPNLQLAYVSSRSYAGYATTELNPEPYAYESAFAVRWLIQDQI